MTKSTIFRLNQFLLLFLCLNTHGFCYIDIATCIDYRTQQYPTGNYKTVCICSPPRTGSTFIYNIVRFLFEDELTKHAAHWNENMNVHKVSKSHGILIDDPTRCVIFTVRNPLESSFSTYRVLYGINTLSQTLISEVVETQINYLHQLNNLLLNNKEAILFRYEYFVNDIYYVYNKLETFFSITIDKQDKSLLAEALDRDNVIANIEKFDSFDHFDEISGFHGNHIELDNISLVKRNIINKLLLKELEKHKEIIEMWGYSYIFDTYSE